MTRTISFITATVGAALLFAVPAYADNWGADQRRGEAGYLSPDAGDRATALAQSNVTEMLNARERALGVSVEGRVDPIEARERALRTKHEVALGSDFYADAFTRAVRAREASPTPVVDDRFRLDPNSVPSPVTVTSSGTEIEWPQIGIGFGIGLVLALGLYLAMRFTRIRPLAH